MLLFHPRELIFIATSIFLVGCGGSSSDLNSLDWYKPKRDISWQWQLQGDINIPIPNHN